ncbi:PAS domain-containing protein [Lasiosphaeris hirsuta]|uniref:PAS domain-containing protein n=1 Tax=Lasiosphaeris hirsuta TaxID=260670 RepID=A0AA40AZH0_9PEZI|nr:PAS domain-containing protein [Lasiosphaeris hirsuta]
MSGGDSLDDIVRQNTRELQRRRSVPQPYTNQIDQDSSDRPLSMIQFGQDGAFQDFQFGNIVPSSEALGAFGGMSGTIGMPEHSGSYSQSSLMAMSNQPDFHNLSPDMMGNMMAFSNLNVGNMGADPNALSIFNSPTMATQYTPTNLDTVNTDFSMDMNVENTPLSASSTTPAAGIGHKADGDVMAVDRSFGPTPPDESRTPRRPSSLHVDSGLNPFHQGLQSPISQEVSGAAVFHSPASGTPRTISMTSGQPSTSLVTSAPLTPATSAPTPRDQPQAKSIYSKSGFDMLRALWYVASRKNPKLDIGAVDMSCAFVACDVTMNDCPIIYVSDNFQNLTGYNQHEILGKNCRFLQSPEGQVEAGTKREFVDNGAVYNLKEAIARGEEIQQSLINYRKGGKPFLNLLTMIPIPWDTDEIKYFIGFQIDLVECPDAISGYDMSGAMQVNYIHTDIGQYIFTPPNISNWEPENGQTLGIDDVSTLLQQFNPKGITSDWHKQSWDKMLLENADDVVHVLSLKGLFLYLSPSCKKVLEYDASELMASSLSSICHPSDIVPVTRELKDAQHGTSVNIVFRIRRKISGYTWFESHGTLWSEQGKGRKSIILVGRKRPVFALRRTDLEANGGIGDSEIWTKVSTSGMFLFVSSNVRSLLDLVPENLEGTSMQDLMRKESRPEFGRTIERARTGKIVSCKHEIQNKRGQVLQANTTFYPGDACEGQKPTFLLAQTKLLKASSRAIAPATGTKTGAATSASVSPEDSVTHPSSVTSMSSAVVRSGSESGGVTAMALTSKTIPLGSQDATLASDDNIFDELKTTRCTSWQYELRQMEKVNRVLAEDLAQLLSSKKKRKRRKGGGNMVRDCANCHTRNTPEWRRGPSGNRDLCNSCGLRWAKQTGRVSPRNSSRGNGDGQSKKSNSPIHSSPLHREVATETPSLEPASKTTATPASTVSTDDYASAPSAIITAAAAATKAAGHFHPPPSRTLLAGGSGVSGISMEMTSIQEERETSA